jgi:glycosyltransferase involved in cell wall biosynthesis
LLIPNFSQTMIKDSPLFSILIANYNNGRYITGALNSTLSQTYKNIEIIIVDDCSTDNSLQILDSYKNNPAIKIAQNDCNKGCGYTKRRCMQLATGELCGFLDPDDELMPTAVETMVQAHIQNPDCSLIGSRSFVCNRYLKPRGISKHITIPAEYSYLTYGHYAHYHFATFKKCLYDKTIGISEEITQAVDQDLYFKLDEVGNILILEQILYKYRYHKNGISTGKAGTGKARYWLVILIYEAYKRRGIEGAEQHAVKLITHPYHTYKYRFGNLFLSPIEWVLQWGKVIWFLFMNKR